MNTRTPLFQVTLQTTVMDFRASEIPGLVVTPIVIDPQTSEYEISLEVRDLPEGMSWAFRYNTDLFERATMERVSEHLQVLVNGILAAPDAPIRQCRSSPRTNVDKFSSNGMQPPRLFPNNACTNCFRYKLRARRSVSRSSAIQGG